MSEKTIAILVTGAFNPSFVRPRVSRKGLDWTVSNPIGKSCFIRPIEAMRARGIGCEEPIVLRALGIQEPDKTHDQVTKQIKRRIERNPDARFLFIGHSLGGIMVAGAMAHEDFDAEIVGGIAAGSPFEGANDMLFMPFKLAATAIGLGKRAKNFEAGLNSYTSTLATSDTKNLHLVCSPNDEVVPMASSGSRVANPASVTVLRPGRKIHLHHAHHRSTTTAVNHSGLLTNRDSAEFMGVLAHDICLNLGNSTADTELKLAS